MLLPQASRWSNICILTQNLPHSESWSLQEPIFGKNSPLKVGIPGVCLVGPIKRISGPRPRRRPSAALQLKNCESDLPLSPRPPRDKKRPSGKKQCSADDVLHTKAPKDSRTLINFAYFYNSLETSLLFGFTK